MDIKIRRFKEDDFKAIMELEKEAFPLDPYTIEMVRQRISTYPEGFWVAIQNNKLAGYIASWIINKQPRIDTMAVHVENQHSGIGSILLTKSLQHFSQKGFESVELEVRPLNVTAINLYKKFGFKKVGVKKGYYKSDGSDALIMKKDLRS